ncbi:MAG: hypothetical protein Q8Q18_02325 [bacterium]|nr:hypothetical protein [bacterium]
MDTTSTQNNDALPLRQRFLRSYANLPVSSRQEVIAVIEEGPITWQAAYLEIDNDTKRGKEILAQIDRLNIL